MAFFWQNPGQFYPGYPSYAGPGAPPVPPRRPGEARRYSVRYVHKISPRPDDRGPDVLLRDADFSDSRALARALREAHARPDPFSLPPVRVEPWMTTAGLMYRVSVAWASGTREGVFSSVTAARAFAEREAKRLGLAVRDVTTGAPCREYAP